jgi:YggT family protein
MRILMNILATLTNLYMILIFIRVMITWFSGMQYSRPLLLLGRITDPYLDWFRRFPLQVANLDLSPMAALIVLSVVNSIFSTLAYYGHITLGIILAMLLSAVWSAAAFFLTLCIIILALRLLAYLTKRNTYSSVWRIVDTLSRPILYRVNRIIFRDRLTNYSTSLIIATAALLVLRIGLGLIINGVVVLLAGLPI